jgi:hypothetical protein
MPGRKYSGAGPARKPAESPYPAPVPVCHIIRRIGGSEETDFYFALERLGYSRIALEHWFVLDRRQPTAL